MPLQIRRGTEAERQAMTIPLAEGELLYVTDDQRLFIGGKTSDGTPILGGIQVTGYNDENAQDAAAALFAAGTHSNITFVYDDSANSITATIDLSDYQDVITADGVRAPILGANDFELFNSVTNDVTLDSVVASDISPTQSGTFDLGSVASTFKDLYLNNSLWISNAQITSDGSVINLPAGTTVNGLPIGSGSSDGIVEGSNYRINIIGEDSALLVDSVNRRFIGDVLGSVISNDGSTLIVNSSNNSINAPGGVFGDVTGDVKGSLFGDDSSLLVDAINNKFIGSLVGNIVKSNNDIVVDTENSSITVEEIILQSPGVVSGNAVFLSNIISIVSSTPSLTEPTLAVAVASDTNIGSSLSLTRARGNALAPAIVENGDEIGALEYGAFVGNAFVSVGNLIATVDGAVTFGQPAPIKLDLSISNGTAVVPVATFKPTQVEFTAVPIVPNLTGTERDALTPQLGMIIYNTTLNKFQGYQTDGVTPNWVDLH